MTPLDIAELKQAMAEELERRRSGSGFSYAQKPGEPEALYGLTGAVNILEATGMLPASRALRAEMAARILAWRDKHGCFEGGSGPGHAMHMVIGTLNMLNEPIPADIAPLAPTDTADLPAWLDRHDWQSTHKELCGQTIPLLASGRVSAEWIEIFVSVISKRLHPERPLETWCTADAHSWRVVSCIFHAMSAFDAVCMPYPQPEMLIRRLFDLHWEDAADSEQRTVCTDGDWAWMLLNLSRQLPQYAEQAIRAIRRVSERRVRQWHENRGAILGASTHDLYCYLWSTGVFQSCVREHYNGGFVRDTLNAPELFRL